MLTSTNTIDLRSIREKKTAVFCITGWNVVVSELVPLFFDTAFHALLSDEMPGEIPVHFLLDEFDFIDLSLEMVTLLAKRGRKKDAALTIVVQSLEQIKRRGETEDYWRAIADNCGTQILTGMSDEETIRYFCELFQFRTTEKELRNMPNHTRFLTHHWSSPHFEDKPNLIEHPAYEQTGLHNRTLEYNVKQEISTGAK